MFTQRNRYRSLSFDSHRKQNSFLGKVGKFLVVILCLAAAIALAVFGVSSCQNKAASQQILSYVSKNNCEFRFEGIGLTLIENHCASSSGLYFMTPEGLRTAPLIDPAISKLIDQYGCDAPNRCAYSLEINEHAVNGQFDYTLNGKEGFYSFEWPQDQQPRLLESGGGSNNP